MAKSKMVSVSLSENGKKSTKTQILNRDFVDRFNTAIQTSKKEYVIDEKATEAYYKTGAGKVQARVEKGEPTPVETKK